MASVIMAIQRALALLCLLATAWQQCVAGERREMRLADKLGQYNIYMNRTTVSGLSAGGFFAVQYHVAFSSQVIGAGIVAGGPYYCAEGILTSATVNCMKVPLMINVPWLIARAKMMSGIDNLEHLQRSRVFLYSGSKDTVVNPGVMKKLDEWYQAFVPAANIKTEFDIPSEHSWVTMDYGNECSFLGSPYINKCHYALAENLYHWIRQDNATAGVVDQNSVFEFDQSEFTTASESMDSTGYVYVPKACQSGELKCKFHISFHGCLQGRETVGQDYVLHAGLAQLAETTATIVLFPQVKKSSLLPLNPNGCFDWWGYAGSNYATRNGKQMQSVYMMARRIAGEI